MPALRAGLVISRPDPAAFVAAVARAEERGVAAVWSTVGGTNPDAVTLFAAAAVRTERVGLGTSIVPTYPRHPVALASQAIALHGLAPGRVRLGIGPSHRPVIEGVFGLPMGKPLDHLREYLVVLRGLLWEGRAEFSGEYFNVRAALPAGMEPPRIPVPVSALRANAFRLAGEAADGAISWLCPFPYLVETALPALREGAAMANRPAPPLVAHVPVAVHPDRERVRAAARAQFGRYGRLPFYAGMFADAGFAVEDGTPPDTLWDSLVVSGDADTVFRALRERQAAGLDDLLISHVPVEDAEAEEAALSAVLAR